MPAKRKRKSSWEFVVRRKGLLPRPLYLTFADEAEGDAYCKRLEALLDRGYVPDEFRKSGGGLIMLSDAVREYRQRVAIPRSDEQLLDLIIVRRGADRISAIDYAWAERWVSEMKRMHSLAPSTIRHHVGALARCLVWLSRRHPEQFPGNPLRSLPKGYATYTEVDGREAELAGGRKREDVERDRRLQDGEEERIRAVLAGAVPRGRLRALSLRHADALLVIFDLALESAMRLREMYTLDVTQIDFDRRTIFLDKTKNGSKRQVPMTSVAHDVLGKFVGERLGLVFPWWQGASLELTTARLSMQFGRIFEAADCPDLKFHDLRHEAISRMYERTTLESAVIRKMVGHMSQRAHDRYMNLRAGVFADRLW